MGSFASRVSCADDDYVEGEVHVLKLLQKQIKPPTPSLKVSSGEIVCRRPVQGDSVILSNGWLYRLLRFGLGEFLFFEKLVEKLESLVLRFPHLLLVVGLLVFEAAKVEYAMDYYPVQLAFE